MTSYRPFVLLCCFFTDEFSDAKEKDSMERMYLCFHLKIGIRNNQDDMQNGKGLHAVLHMCCLQPWSLEVGCPRKDIFTSERLFELPHISPNLSLSSFTGRRLTQVEFSSSSYYWPIRTSSLKLNLTLGKITPWP